MKNYENVSRVYLTRRTPAIIRIDGKAFHTFTKGLNKPFDKILMHSMQETMKYLCENIQGCVFGYTQSDEITLVLTDYATISTDAWFGNNIQKMCSISASMATMIFNQIFAEKYAEETEYNIEYYESQGDWSYLEALCDKRRTALFDSRVFSVPKDNEYDIMYEYYQLIAVVEMLVDTEVLHEFPPAHKVLIIEAKKSKVLQYQQVSSELGCIENAIRQ